MEEQNQELLMKLGMFEQQIRQLQQQLQAVEQAIVEIQALNFGLDELKGKKGKEIFAPIGRGIFAKAQLLSEDLTVDVGSGNLVKKTIPETKALIERQINKLEEVKKELEQALEKISEEFSKLIAEAQEEERKKAKQ